MERKTMWLIGGGLALIVILYAVSRSSNGGGSAGTVSVIPAGAPADPNVLAAQVQQDAIKSQLALASINAAGTIDAINAQSQGNVNQIDATFKGQGYLTKLYGAIASTLNAQTYSAQLGLASIEGQTATELAGITSQSAPVTPVSAPMPSTGGTATTSPPLNRALRIFALGQQNPNSAPSATATASQTTQTKPCWWRTNVPIIGALVC